MPAAAPVWCIHMIRSPPPTGGRSPSVPGPEPPRWAADGGCGRVPLLWTGYLPWRLGPLAVWRRTWAAGNPVTAESGHW